MVNKSGQRLAWRHTPITVGFGNVPEEFHQDIRDAAKAWNDYAGLELLKIKEEDYEVPIYWIPEQWSKNDEEASKEAVAHISWLGDNITEAVIFVNATNYRFLTSKSKDSNGIDMKTLMIHEFGHVLGLDHDENNPKAVMYPYLSHGEKRHKIEGINLGEEYENVKGAEKKP